MAPIAGNAGILQSPTSPLLLMLAAAWGFSLACCLPWKFCAWMDSFVDSFGPKKQSPKPNGRLSIFRQAPVNFPILIKILKYSF